MKRMQGSNPSKCGMKVIWMKYLWVEFGWIVIIVLILLDLFVLRGIIDHGKLIDYTIGYIWLLYGISMPFILTP
jgi:hypothetical protein